MNALDLFDTKTNMLDEIEYLEDVLGTRPDVECISTGTVKVTREHAAAIRQMLEESVDVINKILSNTTVL